MRKNCRKILSTFVRREFFFLESFGMNADTSFMKIGAIFFPSKLFVKKSLKFQKQFFSEGLSLSASGSVGLTGLALIPLSCYNLQEVQEKLTPLPPYFFIASITLSGNPRQTWLGWYLELQPSQPIELSPKEFSHSTFGTRHCSTPKAFVGLV